MRLINLTPHVIRVVLNEQILEIPPSGIVARVTVATSVVGTIEVDGVQIPIHAHRYGEVENLPPPQEGVLYIVSGRVLEAASGRHDLVAPDTSPQNVVRTSDGQVWGVRALVAPSPRE